MPNEPKKYICEKCNYETKFKCAYEKHLVSNKHLSFEAGKKYKYSCEQCNFNTNLKQSYDRHLQSQTHMNNGVRVCKPCTGGLEVSDQCPHCDYTSEASSAMRFHMIYYHIPKEEHHKYFPYYCKCCEVGYVLRSKYMLHIESNRHKNNILCKHSVPIKDDNIILEEIFKLVEKSDNKANLLYEIQKQYPTKNKRLICT